MLHSKASNADKRIGGTVSAMSDIPKDSTAARIASFGVYVADLERSVDFYTGVLGLSVRRRFPQQVLLEGSGQSATLILARRPEGISADDAADLQKVVFFTGDAQDLYRRSIEGGGAGVAEPTARPDMPYTIGLVRDPDGHLLEFIQDQVPQ
jgi:catechol 2,3-dioxygenase-like lactoylglutathione lyase family enzyme